LPRFSIVIPIIKTAFLEKAISSVLKQIFVDWELILYNDCSKENVDILVSRFNDRRIKYYKGEKNLGANDPSKAWNKALSFASGEYVCLLGDDDFLAENFLEEMNNLIGRYPNGNVFRAKLKRVDENGQIFCENDELPEFEDWLSFLYERLVRKRIQSTSEFVLKKKSLLEIGGYVSFLRACGSDDATYLLLAKEKGVFSTNKTHAFWRKSLLNISDNDGENLNKMKLKKLLLWEKEFLDKNFSSKIPVSELYFTINNLLLDCGKTTDAKELFSIKKVSKNFRLFFFVNKFIIFLKKQWYSFLNCPLRQPARKLWYWLRGKKLK